jgi:hypothetical protein
MGVNYGLQIPVILIVIAVLAATSWKFLILISG